MVPEQTVDTFQAARDIRGKHRQPGGSGTGLRETGITKGWGYRWMLPRICCRCVTSSRA